MSESRPAGLPLEGLLVIDLTMAWAGPMAVRALAELGADVIKIESASKMDRWRGGTFVQRGTDRYPDHDAGDRPWNRNSFFNTQNIGKRSLALDLKSDEGKEILTELVRRGDVIAENFASGAMHRLGFDYEHLVAIKPDIIMISMPAFGRTGPERNYIAHGPTIEEMAGNTFLQGYRDGPPMPSGRLAWGDPVAGVNGALAAILAIMHHRRTGEGQHVDLAHVESAIPLNFGAVMEASLNGRNAERIGNSSRDLAPHGVYPCIGDDQWVAIACRSDDEWRALAKHLDATPLAGVACDTTAERLGNVVKIDAVIEEWTATLPPDKVFATLQAAGVACGVVRNASDLSVDEHLRHRGHFVEIDHPEAGRHRYPGMPWRMRHRAPITDPRPAPSLGQHTHEILSNVLGLPDDRIEDLMQRGVTRNDPLPQGD